MSSKLSQFAHQEVAELFSQARRVVKHPGLHILLAPARHPYGRILVIASKKVGNAPTRNKLRRQLKSLFQQEGLYQKGFDCIVILKRNACNLSYQELKNIVFMAYQLPVKSPSSTDSLSS